MSDLERARDCGDSDALYDMAVSYRKKAATLRARLERAEELLRESQDIFVNKLWDAGEGIVSPKKRGRYYAVTQSRKIDAFFRGDLHE